jgi:DNA-binding SARP family transcriptional activator
MALALFLRVLGDVALFRDEPDPGEPLLGPGKPLALLTYLALSPQRAATREHLLDLLWADAEPEAARRNLRQALYQIRRLLGEDVLEAHLDRLALASLVRTDHDAFLSAIEAGEIERAVALYTGPFFPAFAAPGGAGFEQWADLERERLHGAYLRALESLGREALAQHRLKDGVSIARRLRDAAPDREHAWRLLLEALVSSGDWVQAAAEADALANLLQGYSRTAEPATVAAMRAARQAPTHASTTELRLVTEMVGREAEFSTIVAAWNQAQRDRLRHVHVVGTAGIGKTRLLRDCAARIAALGGRVVQLKANQGERELPYALAGDLARELAALPGATGISPTAAGVLLDMDPTLATRFHAATSRAGDTEETQRLRMVVLAELLAAVADEQPVAVVADDLHWADPVSRMIVLALATRAASSRVLLVTSVRPQSGGLDVGSPHDTITLRPFTAEQVGVLMESVAQVPEPLRAAGLFRALADAAQGSPLLVLETLQLALDQQLLSRDDDHWSSRDPGGLFAQLRGGSALERRLAALAPHQHRLLLLLAASGAPAPRPVLDAATRRLAFGAEPGLQLLEQRGFIAPQGDGWEMAHDLITERLLVSATREELAAAHSALGHAWAAEAGDRFEPTATAARFLARAGEREALARLFRLHEHRLRKERDWRAASTLARELLGAEHRALVPELLRALPLHRRWRLLAPERLLAAAALLVVAGLGSVYLALRPRPHHLVLTQQPRVAAPDPNGVRAADRLVVRIADRHGRAVSSASDTVRLSVTLGSEEYGIPADQRAILPVNGEVILDTLCLEQLSSKTSSLIKTRALRIRIEMRGLPPVESDSIFTTFASYLRLDSARLNGQLLTSADHTVRTSPGTRVAGQLYTRYTAADDANLLAAAVPSWGDRRVSYFAVHTLKQTVAHYAERWPFDFTAPSAPGRHRIVVVAATETDPMYIASGTNWTTFGPVWNNGDDVRDWGPESFGRLEREGRADVPWLFPLPGGFVGNMPVNERLSYLRAGRTHHDSRAVLGFVIDVEVRRQAR